MTIDKIVDDKTFPWKLILISKNKVKGKSKYTICLTERTFIDKIEDKYDLESELEIYLQCFVDWRYKNEMKTYCVKYKEKYWKYWLENV